MLGQLGRQKPMTAITKEIIEEYPLSSVVVYTQGRESGGSGFEIRSGVISGGALVVWP
jgi:hypothetical protein